MTDESKKQPDFADLLSRLEVLLQRNAAPEAGLWAVCGLLSEAVDYYDWVGFYLVRSSEPRVLQLGPFVGAPTEHTRIPFGRGICGQVAESHQTRVVDDVTAEDNYLACSLKVRAEVVVPIFVTGQFAGQLDIDSHQVAPFTEADTAFLTEVCQRVAPLVAAWQADAS